MVVLACGPDLSEVDGGGGGSGSSSGSTTNTTMPATTNTTEATSNASADGTGSTGPLDTGPSSATSSGGPDATTDEPGTSTGGTASTSDGSTSGEPPGESYPGCIEDADCPDPYTLCWPPIDFGTPNFCTLECGDAGDCPLPTSGTATTVCEGPPGTDICVLDCSMGDCPDGMSCVDIFGNGAFLRCTRQ